MWHSLYFKIMRDLFWWCLPSNDLFISWVQDPKPCCHDLWKCPRSIREFPICHEVSKPQTRINCKSHSSIRNWTTKLNSCKSRKLQMTVFIIDQFFWCTLKILYFFDISKLQSSYNIIRLIKVINKDGIIRSTGPLTVFFLSRWLML